MSGKEEFRFEGPGSAHDSIIFSRTGEWLASGSQEIAGITLWSLATGKEIRRFPGLAFVFSPDETRIAYSIDPTTVVVAEVSTGRELGRVISGRPISFSPDGGQLASFAKEGDRVQFWKVDEGVFASTSLRLGDESLPSELLFSPQWDYVAAGHNKNLTCWSVATGQKLWTAETDNSPVGPVFIHVISSLAFQPNGHMLAAANWDNSISYWDTDNGSLIRRTRQRAERLRHTVTSPDGHWLATFSIDSLVVVIWDMKGDSGVKKFSISGGGRLADWSPSDTRPTSVSLMAFSSDSRSIAAGRSNTIVLRDVASGRELHQFAGHTGAITSIVFSRDGKWMASGSTDNTARVWDLDSNSESLCIRPPATAQGTEVVGFTPDTRELIVLSRGKGQLTFWNALSGNSISVRPSDLGGYESALLSGDGRRMALFNDAERAVHILNLASGKDISIDSARQPMAFSRDSKVIALAKGISTLQLCDAATGKSVRTLEVGPEMTAISFLSDRNLLAVTFGQGSTALYDTLTGKILLTFGSSWDSEDWVAVAPDGLFDGSPQGMQNLLMWRFGRGLVSASPVEIFFNEFYAPGLISDIFSGRRPRAARPIESIDRRQPTVRIDKDVVLNNSQESRRSAELTITVAEAQPDSERVRGAGVRDVRLFRNGSLVRAWRGEIPLDIDGKATLHATVSIGAGSSRLSAYAFNRANVKSLDADLDIANGHSSVERGTAYVIAVGIDDYANRDFNLKYAVADANDFATTLEHAQHNLGRFARIQTIVLTNRRATKKNILRILSRLSGSESQSTPKGDIDLESRLQPARPEDAVFFYFAGHGIAVGPRYYLTPYDLGYVVPRQTVSAADLRSILSHSISDRDLESGFETVDAGTIAFVLDACNSGQALVSTESRRGPMNSSGLAQLAYEKGMYVLAAAQSYQSALETPRFGHGYLTYALMDEGLAKGAADNSPKDGEITLREWLRYPTVRVPELQLLEESNRRTLEHPFTGSNLPVRRSKTVVDIQQPRVFYRREAPRAELVVEQVVSQPRETLPPARPTVDSLLKDVREVSAKMKSLYIVSEATGSISTHIPGRPPTNSKSKSVHMFAMGPNGQFRQEITPDGPLVGQMITVSDSRYTWTYYGPSANKYTSDKYTKRAIVLATPRVVEGSASSLENLQNAHISREEEVEVGGKKWPCYVVEGLYPLPGRANPPEAFTMWIDKARKIVLRTDRLNENSVARIENSNIVTIARIDEPLDDSLFTFTPPANAKEVPPSELFPQFLRAGMAPPSFKLNDLEDKEVDSTTLRGKVMVLTFWTSWCLPCQDQLATLNTVVSTIKKDDLVVFGINNEPAGVAARYLGAKQLSIPSLVDKDGKVMGVFGVLNIPVTLIIDRGGKLVARFDGAEGESELRAGLKQAGIE